jgi:hypothetical protein
MQALMAVFEFPVPHTVTLKFNEKPRKYNVRGSLTAQLEELSMDDLILVGSWRAVTYREKGNHKPLGPSGRCYWHEGRFLAPILIANQNPDSAEFTPLRPIDVRRAMLSRDRVLSFDATFFYSSQPGGWEHELFSETLSNDCWRPETLPNGEYVEDTFAAKAYAAREFLNSLIMVDGNLFQVTAEPVLACTLDSERETVSIHIRTAGNFNDDWEVFRLDKMEDAIAFAEERWPNLRIEILADGFKVHDDTHLSFDDEGYSLLTSALTLLDSALPSLANLPKAVGMNVIRLKKILPEMDEGRPVVPDTDKLEEIAAKLDLIKPALKQDDKVKLEATIARWNLRPSTSTFSMR